MGDLRVIEVKRSMHELGVVFKVIEQVEAIARENDVTRVEAVTLSLGEVSAVIPEYLLDCWRWAVKRTEVMKEARLEIETIPAVTHCDGCGRDYETVKHGRTCPYCSGGETWLRQGNEFIIKQIEAE